MCKACDDLGIVKQAGYKPKYCENCFKGRDMKARHEASDHPLNKKRKLINKGHKKEAKK